MIKKKDSNAESANNATELPPQRKSLRIGKKVEPEEIESDEIESENLTPHRSESRTRFSCDISKEAYIRLKCFSTVTSEPIVSILTRLIDTYCTIKITR